MKQLLSFAICMAVMISSANARQKFAPALAPQTKNIAQQIRLIGSESAKRVSNSPFMQEAIDAEAGGRISRCKTGHKKRKLAGGGAIYRYKNRYFIIASAHTLYENGKPKCNKNFLHFQPDRHYKDRSGIKYKKRYKLKLPPVNHQEAAEANRLRKPKRSYIDDFTILEMSDSSLLRSQVKNSNGEFRKRQFLELLDIPPEQLVDWSKRNHIRIIGDRKNYDKRRQVVIETQIGCIKAHKISGLSTAE